MSDPTAAAPPPPPVAPPPPPLSKDRGLGWFFAITGAIVLFLTLGCIIGVSWDDRSGDMIGIALLCGSPTLLLGGVFLWLGSRRLKR
jgi:hypothetical protein